MDGIENAAARLLTVLRDRFPAELARVRADRGLDTATLPPPNLWADTEVPSIPLEGWPALLLQALESDVVDLADVDGPVELYRVVYRLRVLLWVRGQDVTATDLLRKRYVTALRSALLRQRDLTAPGGPPTMLLPASIAESYSELFTDDTYADTIAGAWLELRIQVAETVVGETVATANTIAVDLEPLI